MSVSLQGSTALVTGAASGIGRATALALAGRGCHLALVDRNSEGLEETRALCAAYGVRAAGYVLDLSDAAAIAALPARMAEDGAGLGILVNNAGVALRGTFEEVSLEDMEWLFSINFWAAVRMTRAFMPLLKQAPRAHIVNVSSLFGLIAPPGQAAYAASKFALRGFSNALRHELAGSSIGLTVVHPGGVATRIAQDARRPAGDKGKDDERFARLLTFPADKAGEMIAQAIERGTPRLLIGRDARLAALIERLFPVRYWRIIGRHAQ